MRFHQLFTRAVANLSIAAPSGRPSADTDNVLHAQLYSSSGGGPVHRVGIAYTAPSGTLAIDCNAYIWDDLSEAWYLLPGSGADNLVPGGMLFFDLPTPADRIIKPSQDGSVQGKSTGFSVYFQTTDPGAAPAGDHKFAVWAVANQKGN